MEIDADLLSLKDRYDIISDLGQGGMSVVYKARDKTLDRVVALKTLSVKSLTEKQLVQFQAEARALSGLKHKGIMEIIDFGSTRSGKPYMVLEYIEGIPLSKYIEDVGPLPLVMCLSVFVELCEALNHAHNKGVLHRDVKPSNIILVSSGKDSYTPKIIDFGLAVLHTGQGQDSAPAIEGSPPYMSPEQIEGKDLDQRSDIYSLGCTLFEALTGNVPYQGASTLETLNMHKTAPLPVLSKIAGESEIENVLQSCLNKTLAKNKNERFQFVIALQKTLGEILIQAKEAAARKKKVQNSDLDETQLQAKKRGLLIWIFSSVASIALLCLVFNFIYNEYTKNSAKQEELHTNALKHDNVRGAQGKEALHELAHRHDGTEKLPQAVLDQLPAYTTEFRRGEGTIIEADLSTLKRLPKLVRVRFSNCNLTPQQAKQLCTITQLQELEIYSNDMEGADLSCISNLKNLKKLQTEACQLNKKTLLAISKMKSLEDLNIEIEKGVDKEIVDNLTQLPHLTKLKIGGNTYMSEDDKKAIGQLTNIQDLSLDSLLIDDSMAQYLAQNLTGVKKLSLTHNLISIKGLRALLKIPGIEWININACENLTDDASQEALEVLSKTIKHIQIVDESRFVKKEK